MVIVIKEKIKEIIERNSDLLVIPIRQRAKFEGWLKFELARILRNNDFQDVRVEQMYGSSRKRSDVSFCKGDTVYHIELKTPNTNFKHVAIESKRRPITKNIDAIISDTEKLRVEKVKGIIAFVLFPINENSDAWKKYIEKIEDAVDLPMILTKHCEILKINIANNVFANIVVCVYATY